jgi:dGTP triphosphohydrolase
MKAYILIVGIALTGSFNANANVDLDAIHQLTLTEKQKIVLTSEKKNIVKVMRGSRERMLKYLVLSSEQKKRLAQFKKNQIVNYQAHLILLERRLQLTEKQQQQLSSFKQEKLDAIISHVKAQQLDHTGEN